MQVLHDFRLFCTNIDPDALRKRWAELLVVPLSEWKENVDFTEVASKDDNIWKFFILFDRFKKNRSKFYKLIRSLIVFSEVMILLTGKNKTIRNIDSCSYSGPDDWSNGYDATQ